MRSLPRCCWLPVVDLLSCCSITDSSSIDVIKQLKDASAECLRPLAIQLTRDLSQINKDEYTRTLHVFNFFQYSYCVYQLNVLKCVNRCSIDNQLKWQEFIRINNTNSIVLVVFQMCCILRKQQLEISLKLERIFHQSTVICIYKITRWRNRMANCSIDFNNRVIFDTKSSRKRWLTHWGIRSCLGVLLAD